MSFESVHRQLADLGRRRAQHRPARVVVIGNVGNGNTGDEALLAVTLDVLRAVNPPDTSVTVLSRSPDRVRAVHGVHAVTMRAVPAGLLLARADALVVVGGGMFGPGLPPLVALLPFVVTAAALVGRDTAYVGIGAYPGMPAATLAALRRSVRLSRGATVRDAASARLLDDAHPPTCVGDLALHLTPAPEEEADRLLRGAGVPCDLPLLLLAPKAGTTRERTEQLVRASAAAARYWVDRGGAVAALAFASAADHGIDQDDTDSALAARIGAAAAVPVPRLGPDLHPSSALALVARASAVLTLRFHGLVFAVATGVAVTSFAWEPKTQALLAAQGLPVLQDLLDLGQLTTWLDELLADVRRS